MNYPLRKKAKISTKPVEKSQTSISKGQNLLGELPKENMPNHINHVFQTLPVPEIQKLIWNRLNFEEKKTCRQVCKEWEENVNTTLKFKTLLCDSTAGVVRKSTKILEELTVSNLERFKYPKSGLGLKSVKKIMLKEASFEQELLKGKISIDNLKKLLKQFKHVESLELSGKALRGMETPPAFLGKVELNCLQELQIVVNTQDGFGFLNSVEILKNTFPSLKSLLIEVDGWKRNPYYDFYIDPFHTEIFGFISRHKNTLENVTVKRGDIEEDERFVEIRLNDLGEEVEAEIIEELKKVQLKTFDYGITSLDAGCPFAKELFKAQRNLRKIIFGNTEADALTVLLGQWDLPQVFLQCCETLKEVIIMDGVRDAPMTFSCSVLACCLKLESLSLYMWQNVRISDVENLPTKEMKKLDFGEWTLTMDQVYFIAREMHNLETLYLYWNCGGFIMDVFMFKELMKMRKLNELFMNVNGCDFKGISKWVAEFAKGCVRMELKSSQILVTVDRQRFDCSSV